MKFILTLLLLIQCLLGYGQRINELKNDDEVFTFVNKVFTMIRSNYARPGYKSTLKKSPPDTIYKYYRCANVPLNRNIKQWEKIDFNNDGFTDLFIVVDESNNRFPFFVPYVMLSINDTAFKVVDLSIFAGFCQIYYPVKIDQQQLLLSFVLNHSVIYDSLSKAYKDTVASKTDTLIYKFNHFIEYNADTIFSAIQSVSFSHSSCMLPCASYKITIDKSKNITLDGYDHTVYRGHFRSIIAEEKFREIFDLLNYINPKNLKDKYEEISTDGPTAYLEIKFADGTIKKIEDASWEGTKALNIIYNYFEKIYQNQRWYK